MIDKEKPDILAGTEMWLTPDVMNSEIIPPELGYSIYRKDRPDGYGGVLLAVSNKLSSVDLPSLTDSQHGLRDHMGKTNNFWLPVVHSSIL